MIYKDEFKILKKYSKNELDILLTLNHENIIKVEDYFDDNIIFDKYDMDCFEYSLYMYKENKNVNINKIMNGMIDGLIYLHSKNLIHGDLKEENIYLKFRNKEIHKVVIGDFEGCYKVGEKNKTFTISHLSPQLINGNYGEFTDDVWALGIIIYRLKYNINLFEFRNINELVKLQIKILGNPPQEIKMYKYYNCIEYKEKYNIIKKTLDEPINKCLKWKAENRITLNELKKYYNVI